MPQARRAGLHLVPNLGLQPNAVLDRRCTRRQARCGGKIEGGLLRKQRHAILQANEVAIRSGAIGGRRLQLCLLLCLRERRQGTLLQRHAIVHPPRPRRHRGALRRPRRHASSLRGRRASCPVECLIARQACHSRGRRRYGHLVHLQAAAPSLRGLVATLTLLGGPTKPHARLQRVRVAPRDSNLGCGDCIRSGTGRGAGRGAGSTEGGIGRLGAIRRPALVAHSRGWSDAKQP